MFTGRGNTRRTDFGERITCVSVMPGGNNSRREKKSLKIRDILE